MSLVMLYILLQGEVEKIKKFGGFAMADITFQT